MNTNNLKALAQLIDGQYGKYGTHSRDTFEKGYQRFKKSLEEALNYLVPQIRKV